MKEKCQDIGIQLDLDDNSLDRIERMHTTDHSTQLRQILRLWLEREDACWEKLIEVLRVPIIDEEALASKLEAKYCTKSRTPMTVASTSQTPTLRKLKPCKLIFSMVSFVYSYIIHAHCQVCILRMYRCTYIMVSMPTLVLQLLVDFDRHLGSLRLLYNVDILVHILSSLHVTW